MKVDDTQIPTAGTARTPPGKQPSSASSSFSDVLERRLATGETRRGQKSEPFPTPDDVAFALSAIAPAEQNQIAMISEPSIEARSETASIQALIHEILVVAQPNGQQHVELQFNSTTLDGLNVKISQEQRQISIRFSTTSASVSDLISRNLDQLSDALQHKGLQLAPIYVEITPMSSNFESTNKGSRGGRSGEQNERQRQQQQQKR